MIWVYSIIFPNSRVNAISDGLSTVFQYLPISIIWSGVNVGGLSLRTENKVRSLGLSYNSNVTSFWGADLVTQTGPDIS